MTSVNESPEVGSRWDDQRTRFVGVGRLSSGYYTARVMAVAEKYVMARFSGAMPFVVPLKEWHERFKPKPLTKRKEPS